ncbi:beta strand repeat-containing protein, partial [Massilia sp. S19_KUP03_FR1]|uniref:beta strand repeat-containing protein n=1 Tax=Massilia sp. S19_KUP03_FR1 TaxID=3025503 RepID=UPI002FCD763F
ASTTADITKATINAVTGITAGSKVYDGTTTATVNTSGAAFGGMVNGDSLNATASGAFADKNAATGKTVTVSGIALGGADAGNYTLASTTASATADITKATINAVSGINASSKVYDGTTKTTVNTSGAAFAGMVNGDSLNATASGAFSDKNAAIGKTVNLSGIALGGADAGNYTLASNTASATADITKATINAVSGITAGSKVYDGTTTTTVNTSGAAFAGMVNGDSLNASASGSFRDKNAATGKTVNVSAIALGGADAGNYTLAANTASATADITQATINAVTGITAGSKVYDGTTSATVNTGGAAFAGMVNGDSLNATASGAFSDKNAAIGKTVNLSGIALGGADAGNYTLASNTSSATADITKATINAVTGITAGSKVYDGTTKTTVNTSGAAFAGMVNGDSLNATASGAFANKNAAIGKTVNVNDIALGGADAGNYTLASNTASTTADITKATINAVTGITAGSKVYDGTTTATVNTSGAAFGGMVNGDSLNATASGAFANKNAATGKTVTVSGIALGGADAGNYTLASTTASATADITKATINAVSGINASSKVYDGTTKTTVNTSGAAFAGMVNGDSLNATASGAFSDKNAAIGKTVNLSGIALGGLDAGNYTLASTTASATADITKATINAVTGITAGSKVYDGTTTATVNTSGAAFSGMVNGDSLNATAGGAFADKNAAIGKTVNVSAIALGGADAANYTLAANTASATADITKATINAVTGLTAGSKVYDGTTSATVNTTGAAFAGMVGGDSLSASGTAVFADKNAGNGKTVAVSGIVLGGTDAANYTLGNTSSNATGNITPKALTIVGMTAANKAYDGNTKATLSGGSVSGLVGSETLGVTGLSASFADKNAGTGKTVTATGATLVDGGNGGLAANYTISNPSGLNANITPKALTVTGMTVATRAYDGSTAANLAGGTLSGLVSGETLVLSGGSGAFADKNVGNGKAVTVSGLSLADGAGLASNYAVSNPTGVTANITQKALTVSGALAQDKTYDGSASATISGGALSGMVGSETVNLTG